MIVGAGYGGLCAGARLREQGLAPHEVRIVDTASQVGGTWYWNRYPGAQCDIESYTYAPLCEELGYIPTEKYARQPELLAHSQMIAVKYDLLDNACLSTVVTGMVWDEAEGRWTVTTNRGDRMRARFVITNFGTFTQPKLPKVPGLASFEGHMFHTSRWDYEYTGGTSMGGLDKLHNKRVGVIGTGATSVQIVPHLGQAAKELCVFQRTPSSVDVRNQRTTDLDVVREQMTKPGWQRERMVNFVQMTQTPTVGVTDLIQDGWTDSVKNLFKKFHAERWAALQGGNKAAVRRINELMELAGKSLYQTPPTHTHARLSMRASLSGSRAASPHPNRIIVSPRPPNLSKISNRWKKYGLEQTALWTTQLLLKRSNHTIGSSAKGLVFTMNTCRHSTSPTSS